MIMTTAAMTAPAMRDRWVKAGWQPMAQ